MSLVSSVSSHSELTELSPWCFTLSLLDPFQKEIETNHEVIAMFRHDIMTYMNESNVAQFLRCYNSRTALELKRPVPGVNLNGRTLK